MTSLIITITAEPMTFDGTYTYHYQDRILKNVFTGDYEIIYSGQNQGRRDAVLLNGVATGALFKIYYRKTSIMPFTYLGSTTRVTVLQARRVDLNTDASYEDRLLLHCFLPADQVCNAPIESDPVRETSFRHKKAILAHNEIDWTTNPSATQFFLMGFYACRE